MPVLFPLRVAILASQLDIRPAILYSVRVGRRNNLVVYGIVVGTSDLDVRLGILVVVWLDVRGDDLLCLKVVFAEE